MNRHIIDILIIICYIVLIIAAGLYLCKRASQNLDSYFLGGKSIPWEWPMFDRIFRQVYLGHGIRRSNVLAGAEWLFFRHDRWRGCGIDRPCYVAVVYNHLPFSNIFFRKRHVHSCRDINIVKFTWYDRIGKDKIGE